MPANDYTFVTDWRVEGTPQLVFDILDDPAGYPRWWPSVWPLAGDAADVRMESSLGHGAG